MTAKVINFERAAERLLRKDERYMAWAREVWALLGEETDLLGPCRLMYAEGVSPADAAQYIENNW